MNKRLPIPLVIAIVVAVVGVCAYIYSRLPIGPVAPPVAKGANRPPPGMRAHKNAMAKAAQGAKDKQATSDASAKSGDEKGADTGGAKKDTGKRDDAGDGASPSAAAG